MRLLPLLLLALVGCGAPAADTVENATSTAAPTPSAPPDAGSVGETGACFCTTHVHRCCRDGLWACNIPPPECP